MASLRRRDLRFSLPSSLLRHLSVIGRYEIPPSGDEMNGFFHLTNQSGELAALALMFKRAMTTGLALSTVLFAAAALLSQAPSAAPSFSADRFSGEIEFPVSMRQNVIAGATAVGTKIEAKLAVATLVKGVVVPQGAILSGVVTESVAKSASGPSRLAIRMDLAQWKNGAMAKVVQFTKVYLTAWYYPLASLTPRDPFGQVSDDPTAAQHRGMVPPYATPPYPDPTLTASQPFPGSDLNRGDGASSEPPGLASRISQHRVLIKNVESTRN
ncbi:MAG: hypothetical protein WB566_01165, partial [Terriglobales bacterium]